MISTFLVLVALHRVLHYSDGVLLVLDIRSFAAAVPSLRRRSELKFPRAVSWFHFQFPGGEALICIGDGAWKNSLEGMDSKSSIEE